MFFTVCGKLEKLVKERHHRLGTFATVPLHRDEFQRQEIIEGLTLQHFRQDSSFSFLVHSFLASSLEGIRKPFSFLQTLRTNRKCTSTFFITSHPREQPLDKPGTNLKTNRLVNASN